MGRGRAKAKQTKVARELKYSSPGMDLDRLTKDLQSDQHHVPASRDDEDSPYAQWPEDDGENSAAS